MFEAFWVHSGYLTCMGVFWAGALPGVKRCQYILQRPYSEIFRLFKLKFNHFFQGWFTPGQIFVLDEYCARYGVRSCFRHLRYLEDLLDRSEKDILIDPTLIHFSYAFCASHVHGNRYVSKE